MFIPNAIFHYTELSKFSKKFLLLENISLKLKNRPRKCTWINQFSRQKHMFGEFYHPYTDTRVHANKLKDYLRMSKEIFDTLLKKLELYLCRAGTKNRECISAEQWLIVR
jgi:hypothetical protein